MATKSINGVEAPKQTQNQPKVKSTIADGFHNGLKWIDVNILPLIALPVLATLAADDIKGHLTHVTPEVALGVGIAFAAILAVKSHK